MEVLAATIGLFTGGGAAATGATAAAGAAGVGAATGGISLSSILTGITTVGGLAFSVMSGSAEAAAMKAQAADADREQALENLQGIDRRRALKAAASEAIGEMDAAYAASGVDLSFGSARQARQSAYRELDLGLTSDAGTQETRLARLQERAANYRRAAKRAKLSGVVGGIAGAADALRR